MSVQEQKVPQLKIPMIMDFLAKAVLDLNGCHTEGIFRVRIINIFILINVIIFFW